MAICYYFDATFSIIFMFCNSNLDLQCYVNAFIISIYIYMTYIYIYIYIYIILYMYIAPSK